MHLTPYCMCHNALDTTFWEFRNLCILKGSLLKYFFHAIGHFEYFAILLASKNKVHFFFHFTHTSVRLLHFADLAVSQIAF